MSTIYGTSWLINIIDKNEHMFYTINYKKQIQRLAHHTNGFGAPLIRQVF